mmetsp:Transcript_10390/g.25136  ORF Transcript_10390/g.25136 Transcript_10390/m.25136 type:complete len:243 (-) Transcript_10390:708-1436(-)|eukprot:CAMPEP_0197181880 /NCGR_PEP_ID=MMETSP1423-20130617/6030_1 /TAXON_ID=476441 /ORGANISM="Pseudo-nitzschia heimii, Strain UNC1101" /LENGTH=242 /DNA_ID=CAMNT_0042632221 /DNA_START=125 /DNA_END=853 /DNA_ORIENTATION=+
MGQVCSGAKEESSRPGPLDVPSSGDAITEGGHHDTTSTSKAGSGNADQANSQLQQRAADPNEAQSAASAALADLERRKRRELWIVNGAARGMVAVRSTRGSTGYYDQGFAGLLAQHLEQTTSFPNQLPLVLPPVAPLKPRSGGSDEINGERSSSKEVSRDDPGKKCTFYDRLAQPRWDGMELNVPDDPDSKLRGREASAAASGDPQKLMDALAESLLDGPHTVLPAKQQLFAGVKPMVENLL